MCLDLGYFYKPKCESSSCSEFMAEHDSLCLEYPAWGVRKKRDHFNHPDHNIALKYQKCTIRKKWV